MSGLEEDALDMSMDISNIERHTSELATPTIKNTEREEVETSARNQNTESEMISVATPDVGLTES